MVELDEEQARRAHGSPAPRGKGPCQAGGRADAGLQGKRARPAGRGEAERPALEPAGPAKAEAAFNDLRASDAKKKAETTLSDLRQREPVKKAEESARKALHDLFSGGHGGGSNTTTGTSA